LNQKGKRPEKELGQPREGRVGGKRPKTREGPAPFKLTKKIKKNNNVSGGIMLKGSPKGTTKPDKKKNPKKKKHA